MKNIPARLDRLEQRNPQGKRITEIHLVDGFTGEVGAVIHVQDPRRGLQSPDVLRVLEEKHAMKEQGKSPALIYTTTDQQEAIPR